MHVGPGPHVTPRPAARCPPRPLHVPNGHGRCLSRSSTSPTSTPPPSPGPVPGGTIRQAREISIDAESPQRGAAGDQQTRRASVARNSSSFLAHSRLGYGYG